MEIDLIIKAVLFSQILIVLINNLIADKRFTHTNLEWKII